MRVALFTDNFRGDMGGGTKIVIDLAKGLRDEGHEVLVVTGQETDEAAEGFRVFNLPSLKFPFYDKAEMVFPSIGLIRTMKEFNPDIIHYHEPFTAGILALLVSKNIGKPVVGSIYIDPSHVSQYTLKIDRGGFAKALVGFMSRQSDALVFISEYQRKTYERFLDRSRITKVIYPGIPDYFFRGKAEFGKTVVTVCRLAPEKNLSFGFRVIAKLQRMGNFDYLLVGEGPERKKLEKLAKKLNLKVEFLGNLKRERLPDLYSRASLFFLPSKTETFGLVLAEAMASGLPVVALGRGAAPEVIGEGGIICEENEDRVAEAMASLLENSRLWKEKSEKARERAKFFKMDRFVREHEELYGKLL
ncbi:glycosyltransferase involved in cell wall biosynthesis [Hydrogenivirga caldilitoris]|uniref:Glycosyltransferase involved in cell wall biosynthesis n=1 Tax=Hydrogenivirga caldilitoris TaxID=246264 RepID=A0A497XPW0_9AQUI|nr:glycosyltransferase [Hydrogenivirga caldilitoris]RLJ70311.1 glycosyltransferase involved in cell wall biosynthesis [Hydrogenivirga caldilitoris]